VPSEAGIAKLDSYTISKLTLAHDDNKDNNMANRNLRAHDGCFIPAEFWYFKTGGIVA
jgi:hypothetical protein